MSHPRTTIDLAAFPDLVVVYLGYRASSLRSALALLRIGRGLGAVRRNKPDGLLAHEPLMFGLLHPGVRQYWRDFESLERFTRDPLHMGWWREFARDSGGGGIWHEAYRLRGGMEAIYSGMPPIGFASFAPERTPIGPFMHARQRIGEPPAAAAG
jgi:hypothetical protein